MRVPPRPIRTLVISPIAFVGSLVVTLLSPLLHLLLAMIDIVDRKNWRFTRVVGLGIAFCVVELFGLVSALVLWVASGFGLWMRSSPIQRAHSWVLAVWLELITRAIRVFLGFRFEFPRNVPLDGPVLVLCRHAGPGDSLLVARALLREDHLRVRMVGTTKLLWDPFFNHIASRLPFHFCKESPIDPAGELLAVRQVAATIESNGAMIVFPEGGNYTPRRWDRAIERLEARGQTTRAEQARRMRHVLPPRTGTTLAALEGAAEANVVIVAHVGLDDLLSLGDIWRRVPIRRTVRATFWHAPAEDRPNDHVALGDWLFDQWEAVDTWIAEQYPTVF